MFIFSNRMEWKAKTAPGFFDVELRMQFLEAKGDPLIFCAVQAGIGK